VKLLSKRLLEYFLAKEMISGYLPEYIDMHVVIDSRLVKKGDTFVCISGEKTDGHDHINDAIQNGAIGFVVNRFVDIPKGCFQIITSSTELAIQYAASKILKETKIKQIAVTGSAGKTTTKELLFSLFSPYWKTAKTQGNYNTPVGVPVSIINMIEGCDTFLCELSASYPGEIDHSLSFLNLDTGIITGIGSSHLEFFGSTEKIFSEKMKIASAIQKKGLLLINGDQEWGKKAKDLYPDTLCFGLGNENDIQAFNIQKNSHGTTFNVRFRNEILSDLTLSTLGDHFIYDALPGIYLALKKGMPVNNIRLALGSFQAEKGRGKISTWLKNSTIIDESYNANPFSFALSLQAFKNYLFPRRIAIIGDMLELGSNAPKLHFDLGKLIAESNIQVVIYKGMFLKEIQSALTNTSIQLFSIKEIKEIEPLLLSVLKEGDGILIKASNGVGLHELMNQWENNK
jgi:UDP-N-acetylmuramoyl-tripeptide--D-alanyl-D-alanine ligase